MELIIQAVKNKERKKEKEKIEVICLLQGYCKVTLIILDEDSLEFIGYSTI